MLFLEEWRECLLTLLARGEYGSGLCKKGSCDSQCRGLYFCLLTI